MEGDVTAFQKAEAESGVFESYKLVENNDGSRVYTSNPIGSARVAIIHYAETGEGKNRESHHVAEGVPNANVNVTITPQ